jgi:hypothetical protein
VDPAEQEWERVHNSTDPAELDAFAVKYPNSPRAAEARALRDRLQQEAAKAKQANEDKAKADAQAKLAADRTQILGALKEWETAMGSRDMTTLTKVFPSYATQKSIVDLFSNRDVTKITMVLKPKGDPQISGDTARIAVDRTVTQVYKQASPPPRTDSPTVTFVRKQQVWVIDSVK